MGYADRLKENLLLSDQVLSEMKVCTQSFEAFSELLKRYIQLRFVIDDTDYWTDNIKDLSAFSMKHQQEVIGDDDSAIKDTSLNCAGATSADTKQILLLMKLRRDLNVELSPAFMGTAESVTDIAQRLFSQLS